MTRKQQKRPARWLLAGHLGSTALHYAERVLTLGENLMIVDLRPHPWIVDRLKKHGDRVWFWKEDWCELRVERRMNAIEFCTGIVLFEDAAVTEATEAALVRMVDTKHGVPPTVVLNKHGNACSGVSWQIPSGLPMTGLICSESYGQMPWWDWLSCVCIDALLNGTVTVRGANEKLAQHELVAADDVAIAIESAAAHMSQVQGKVFQIGSGVDNVIAEREIADLLVVTGNRCGIAVTIRECPFAEYRLPLTDSSQFRALTGWVPKVSVRRGIEQLFLWSRDQRAILEKLRGTAIEEWFSGYQ